MTCWNGLGRVEGLRYKRGLFCVKVLVAYIELLLGWFQTPFELGSRAGWVCFGFAVMCDAPALQCGMKFRKEMLCGPTAPIEWTECLGFSFDRSVTICVTSDGRCFHQVTLPAFCTQFQHNRKDTEGEEARVQPASSLDNLPWLPHVAGTP